MPSEQGARLLKFLTAKDMSQADLARRLGVNSTYVSNIVTGVKNCTLGFADRLRDAIKISPHWLLYGRGPMHDSLADGLLAVGEGFRMQLLKDKINGALVLGLAKSREQAIRLVLAEEIGGELAGADAASSGSGQVAEGKPAYTRLHPVRIQLVGRVSANPDPDVIWDEIDPPEYRELPKGAFALEVRGDSMRPVAMPGQAVIAVDDPVENGDLAAVELRDGRQLFKRWWWRKGRKNAILESVRREAIEPPVSVKLRDCRHVWKVIGVLF